MPRWRPYMSDIAGALREDLRRIKAIRTTPNRCPYCGRTNNPTSPSCQGCGAPK